MNDEEKRKFAREIGGCREELHDEGAWTKCWKPAEFVLWGKLFPPEALGPRCYDHAAKHMGNRLDKHTIEQSAIIDVREYTA